MSTDPGQGAPLEGTQWRLVELQHPSGTLSAPKAAASVKLVDGQFTGSTGCNRLGARYTLQPPSADIRIDAGALSMMACPDDAMEQENSFMANLERTTSYRIDGSRMVLRASNGDVLMAFELSEPPALVGTRWKVTGYNNGRGAVVSVKTGTELFFEFAADGTVTGSAGCNTFRSTYTRDGNAMKLTPAVSTRRACVEPGVMEQEATFLSAFGMVVAVTSEDNFMQLRGGDGEMVVTLVAGSN